MVKLIPLKASLPQSNLQKRIGPEHPKNPIEHFLSYRFYCCFLNKGIHRLRVGVQDIRGDNDSHRLYYRDAHHLNRFFHYEQKLEKKIEDFKKKVEDWVNAQIEMAQKKMEEQKKKLEEEIIQKEKDKLEQEKKNKEEMLKNKLKKILP